MVIASQSLLGRLVDIGWRPELRPGLVTLGARLVEILRERQRERRDRRLLASMSDRELRDLGISRYEIDSIVRRDEDRERSPR